MEKVGYNQVLNAFIDALPFDRIPNTYKKDVSVSNTPSRDDVCAAVRTMILDWQILWSRGVKNFDKVQIIQKVEDARELLIREEEDKELIDETRIAQLLTDMIPEYKDGTYQRALAQREVFLVLQMSQFLERAGVEIPQVITQYLSEH